MICWKWVKIRHFGWGRCVSQWSYIMFLGSKQLLENSSAFTGRRRRRRRILTCYLCSSHRYQRMRVLVPPQKVLKEWTGGCQDHLVSFHLLTILTCQSHISKVIVFSQVSKSNFDVVLEVFFTGDRAFLTVCITWEANRYWCKYPVTIDDPVCIKKNVPWQF